MDVSSAARVYLAHLRAERGLSPNTLAAYRRDLAKYYEFLSKAGATNVTDVERSQVSSFMERLAEEQTATSQRRILSSVRGFHKYLRSEHITEFDPTEGVASPRVPSALPKALTHHEVDLLLAAASGDGPQELRDRAFLEVAYATGARVSELVALAVDDIDTSESLAFVTVTGKGSKQRLVPVGSSAIEAVDAYLVRGRPALAVRGRGNASLFLNLRGNPLSRQSAWGIIQLAAQRAGIERDISPHTLRHSFATHLVEGGADVRVVAELLGHASVTTTQIYTKLTQNTLREMYLEAHPRAR